MGRWPKAQLDFVWVSAWGRGRYVTQYKEGEGAWTPSLFPVAPLPAPYPAPQALAALPFCLCAAPLHVALYSRCSISSVLATQALPPARPTTVAEPPHCHLDALLCLLLLSARRKQGRRPTKEKEGKKRKIRGRTRVLWSNLDRRPISRGNDMEILALILDWGLIKCLSRFITGIGRLVMPHFG